MKVLLTFTGMRDPYRPGPIDGQQQPGPILSLAKVQGFDRIVLFSTPKLKELSEATKKALEAEKPSPNVEVRSFPIDDPTDYLAILKGLRTHIKEIRKKGDNDQFFISIASGTPQMHACWLMLAASGEIPARVLHVRPPEFVSKDRPVVYEVDLSSPEFPSIRTNFWTSEIRSERPSDIRAVAKDLGIVGDHDSLNMVLKQAAALAQAPVPVLVLGENGTGKELIARFIHRLSGRARGPFVAVNCAALPDNLAESILFGHKKGAFTGSVEDQPGEFENAHGGTLFLDEVGELSLGIQPKLLRVLQDQLVKRLGEKQARKVDVRIIAATNRDLQKAIKEAKFRPDLYFRLNVGNIPLPPLRERRSDIPKIALHVLDKCNASLRKHKTLSAQALERLQAHPWAGNVRELANVIERSVLVAEKDKLDAGDLKFDESPRSEDVFSALPEPHDGFSLRAFQKNIRANLIDRALKIADGNQSKAARLLGVSPQALHKYQKEESE